MGLIKAAAGALGGTLADQWKEMLYCEGMSVDTLVVKGEKRLSGQGRSSNTSGESNIISNGSLILVNEGQCMLIVEQGKVVELCAEPGEYLYDKSTEPSIFVGELKQGVRDLFNVLGKRFTFGGDTGKDQRVYYINTKEILGNKYGTPSAIPFRVVDKNIGLDMDISIRCFGEYSYRIVNPLLFYANVCGNITEPYLRGEIDAQLKTELMTSLQPAFAQISALGIRYSALPAHTAELARALNEVLSKKWRDLRGLEIVSFGVSSVKASEEDEQLIKELQRNRVLTNPSMAAAHLVGAQAEAMKAAAANEGNMGAALGFMGMNMAQNSGGFSPMGLFQQGQTIAAAPNQAGGWTCSCGTVNQGKFCTNCGQPKSVPQQGWTCSCGAVNKGKFCSECGAKKPAAAPLYKCDKCGWEPADPTHPPKFCPECGDIFDENDKQ